MTKLAAGMVFCPVHGSRVPVDEQGHLLARCTFCVRDLHDALLTLANSAARAGGRGREVVPASEEPV